jgi:hypothetical protein
MMFTDEGIFILEPRFCILTLLARMLIHITTKLALSTCTGRFSSNILDSTSFLARVSLEDGQSPLFCPNEPLSNGF